MRGKMDCGSKADGVEQELVGYRERKPVFSVGVEY